MQKQKHSRESAIIKQNIDKLKNDMVNFLDTEKLQRNQVFYNHEQICDLSKLVLDKNLLFRETAMQKRVTTTDYADCRRVRSIISANLLNWRN